MFTVSFYSYKGGVGRTVSLLNTAWYLAEKGRKILLWDLDLEAPGLQDAYLFNEKQNNKNIWTTPRLKGGFEDIVKIFVKEARGMILETILFFNTSLNMVFAIT